MKTRQIISVSMLGLSVQACSTVSDTWDSMWEKEPEPQTTAAPDPHFPSQAQNPNTYQGIHWQAPYYPNRPQTTEAVSAEMVDPYGAAPEQTATAIEERPSLATVDVEPEPVTVSAEPLSDAYFPATSEPADVPVIVEKSASLDPYFPSQPSAVQQERPSLVAASTQDSSTDPYFSNQPQVVETPPVQFEQPTVEQDPYFPVQTQAAERVKAQFNQNTRIEDPYFPIQQPAVNNTQDALQQNALVQEPYYPVQQQMVSDTQAQLSQNTAGQDPYFPSQPQAVNNTQAQLQQHNSVQDPYFPVQQQVIGNTQAQLNQNTAAQDPYFSSQQQVVSNSQDPYFSRQMHAPVYTEPQAIENTSAFAARTPVAPTYTERSSDIAPAHNLTGSYSQTYPSYNEARALNQTAAPTYPPAQNYQAPVPTYQAAAQTYQAPAQTYQAPAYGAATSTYQQPAYQAAVPVQATTPKPAPREPVQTSSRGVSYNETMRDRESEISGSLERPYYGNTVSGRLAHPGYVAPIRSMPAQGSHSAWSSPPASQYPVVQAPVSQPIVRPQVLQSERPSLVQQPVATPMPQPAVAQPMAPVQPAATIPAPQPVAGQLARATPNGPTQLVMGLHTNAETGGWLSRGLVLHLVDHSNIDNVVQIPFKGANYLAIKKIPAGTYKASKLTLGSQEMPLLSTYVTVQPGHTVYAGNIVVDISEAPNEQYRANIAMEDHFGYTVQYAAENQTPLTDKVLMQVQAKPSPQGTGRFQGKKGFFSGLFGG